MRRGSPSAEYPLAIAATDERCSSLSFTDYFLNLLELVMQFKFATVLTSYNRLFSESGLPQEDLETKILCKQLTGELVLRITGRKWK